METQGPLSGQTLGGKYLLAGLLGEGGFGAVYRGHHLLLDRPQAIKVLHEHYFRKPKFRERFLREAQIVAALDHPHIVHIDDFGMDEQEAKTYLVMPFISGGTFSEILKELQEPLPVEQVVLYLEQICSALDYAHQRGVVHLDLKPLNLLISKEGELLLSDFGLAHSLNQEAVDGGTSLSHGTPHYMAPEHINGQPNKSSDVYALGVILFEMLVGQRPFTGTTPEVMLKHLTKPPPLLRSLRPDLPIELEEVLERALAKQADQRFRSASALLTAFKGALARVQEQVLKAEEERLRKAEEEQARKAQEEQLQKAKEEQALRAEIERLQRAEVERARKAQEEQLQKAQEEQALRAEVERLQRAEEKRVRKAEEVRLRRVETTTSPQEFTPPALDTLQSSMPMQVPQAMSPPMPQTQSKPPLVSTSKPPSRRTTSKTIHQAPRQKPIGVVPSTDFGPTTRSNSNAPRSTISRPASSTVHKRGGSAGPKSAIGKSKRRPATKRNRSRRPRRLQLVLASIVVMCVIVILFSVVLYLNTTSTVKLTVITQNYAHPITLTLSEKNQLGTVPAKSMNNTFTQTGSEPATGSTMQVTNQATGIVNFTNTGTTSVQIEPGTIIATASNIQFVTTATALIPPQSPTTAPLPVPTQAVNQGVSGNVLAKSITVIPQDSLTSIAAAQSPPVTADRLKATLTVSNPEATTGGNAHQVPAVTQQDLDNAKQDLHQQLVGAINAWVQQNAKNTLVGQLVTTDTLTNAPTVDTPEPNKTFSASISVAASILIAQLNDVRGVAKNQLKNAVHADKLFGPTFAIIGDVNIDLAQQSAGEGNTVTVPASGKASPNLNTADLQNSIKGKSLNEAEAILHQQSQSIKTVQIQTQPAIFNCVSPWVDHITVIIQSAT